MLKKGNGFFEDVNNLTIPGGMRHKVELEQFNDKYFNILDFISINR